MCILSEKLNLKETAIKKLIFFLTTTIIFSACANLIDKELDAQYFREPIFMDAKDRQDCKIAHFFNQVAKRL